MQRSSAVCSKKSLVRSLSPLLASRGNAREARGRWAATLTRWMRVWATVADGAKRATACLIVSPLDDTAGGGKLDEGLLDRPSARHGEGPLLYLAPSTANDDESEIGILSLS